MRYCFWIFFFFVIGTLKAQNLNYTIDIQHFESDKGLSSNNTYDVLKDSQGVIWVATNSGLNRFDGEKFQKVSIPNIQAVHHLVEDADGFLWIIERFEINAHSIKNVVFWNIYTQEILTFEERFKDKKGLEFNNIVQINQEPNGNIHINTNQAAVFIYSKNQAFKNRKFSKEYPIIFNSHQVGDNIWVFSTDLLRKNYFWKCYDKNGQIITQKQVENFGRWVKMGVKEDSTVFYFHRKNNKKVEIYSFDNDGKLEVKNSNKYQPLDDWKQPIDWDNYLVFHPNQQVYLAALSGQFQLRDFKTQELIYDFQPKDGITNQIWRTPFFENDNNCWIPTSNGIFLIRWQPNYFQKLLYEPNFTPSTRSIIATKDSVLIVNSYKGSFIVDLKNQGKIKQIPFIENFAIDLLQDKNGIFWFGATNKLIAWNRQTNRTKNYSFQFQKVPETAQSLIEIEGKGIGFMTRRGIGFLDIKTEKIVMEYPLERKPTKWFGEYQEAFVQKHILFSFQRDKSGQIWCLTNNGLIPFDFENGMQQRFSKSEKGKNYLPANSFRHFHEDKDGVFWLATGDAGLVRWDRKAKNGEHFQAFNQVKGLHSDVLYSIFEDDFGYLWLSSDNGLVQFDKTTFEFINYLPKDGITAEDFNRLSHFQSPDGTIYFGSLDGITAFQPKNFVKNLQRLPNAKLFITNFEQFDGKEQKVVNKTAELLNNQIITLRPNDGFFSLTFLLDEYLHQEKVRYAYKIEGLDKTWTESYDNTIRVVGLPYGEYTLHIKGKMPNGRFSTEELRFPIVVKRPFYLQWWFLILSIIALIVGVFTILKYRTFQLTKQQIELENLVNERTSIIQAQNAQLKTDKETIAEQAQKLQQLDELKTQFFTNVSHEFRTPLSLILGPIRSVLKHQKLTNVDFTKLKKAEHNSEELLRLVNEILDISKLEAGELQLENEAISLYALVNRIFASFESQALTNEVDFVLKYLPDTYLNIEIDVQKLASIITNLLSNALKFTPKNGRIVLKIIEQPNKIKIEVTDTGRGIHENDLPNIFNRFYQSQNQNNTGGTGIGLAICKEYSKLMNGKIWAESPVVDTEGNVQHGSRFMFEFPKVIVAKIVESVVKNPLKTIDKSVVITKTNYEILVVEDNANLRQYLKEILQPFYKITIVINGEEALNVLQNQHFHLIISDVLMPVMDGFELLENLKKSKKWRTIPIVMLTARAKMDDKLKALRIGVDDYIVKPFDEAELLVRIENLLKNYAERLAVKQPKNNEPNLSKADEVWLQTLETIIKNNLENYNTTIDMIADEMNISRTAFYTKVKQLIGLSPNQYLQEIRLTTARQLLENKTIDSVKGAAYSVGMKDVKYFSKLFKKRFGISPSMVRDGNTD